MFNEHFLYKAMGWLLPQLQKPAEKQYGSRNHLQLPDLILLAEYSVGSHWPYSTLCYERDETFHAGNHGPSQRVAGSARVGVYLAFEINKYLMVATNSEKRVLSQIRQSSNASGCWPLR